MLQLAVFTRKFFHELRNECAIVREGTSYPTLYGCAIFRIGALNVEKRKNTIWHRVITSNFWFVKNSWGTYIRTYKEPPVRELEALCNSHKACMFAMQYYVTFCSCMELKICHEVMCEWIFTKCSQTFAKCSRTFVNLSQTHESFFTKYHIYKLGIHTLNYCNNHYN